MQAIWRNIPYYVAGLGSVFPYLYSAHRFGEKLSIISWAEVWDY